MPFYDDNHVAMGLTQLLLTVIIMVINQKFFISGYKALWHRAPMKKLDEKRTGSLLHDLVLYAFRFQNYNKMQEPFDINKEVSDTIRRLARKGPCIFIGMFIS